MRVEPDPALQSLTERAIGAAFCGSSTLGHGFLEVVYKRAFIEERTAVNLRVVAEKPYPIVYRGKLVGRYIADIVVEEAVIVEVKAVEALTRAHCAQVLNYLKASRLPVGLLTNFAKPSLEMKRILLALPRSKSV